MSDEMDFDEADVVAAEIVEQLEDVSPLTDLERDTLLVVRAYQAIRGKGE